MIPPCGYFAGAWRDVSSRRLNDDNSVRSEQTERGHMRLGQWTHEEFMEVARKFHGYPAPGLIIGAYMVELAKSHMPGGVLYDAISETSYCLPDAIQLLTPCTIGNGWMKILNFGLYAMSLYDKRTGEGVRVRLDLDKLDAYPTIRTWYMKTAPKKEQDSALLQEEIYEAGISILSARPVTVKPEFMGRRDRGGIVRCAICGEPHPGVFGTVCRSCRGESPYVKGPGLSFSGPELTRIPVTEAVGRVALHDMTRIEPGVSKGPAVIAGQTITGGDLCRLQLMGRNSIYVDDKAVPENWVHENDVAESFRELMPGEGVDASGAIREGKISFRAAHGGVFWVNEERLFEFNSVPEVICATRHCGSVVDAGAPLASSRAIPLYLARKNFLLARDVLSGGPLFSVLPLRRRRIGILITGTEVFRGLIEDRFEPVISQKVQALGCEIVRVNKSPDDARLIREGVESLLDAGAEVVITTAGLSVDPDDVTRKGLLDAGLRDMLYGIPVLPGAMSLVGSLGGEGDIASAPARVIGVPACALFHKTTAFDVLLPCVLADAPLTREYLSGLGHGGLCLDCKTCTYPKCTFAR